MRIRQVLVFALVALFAIVGVAHAAKTTPVVILNISVTAAEQISSSASVKACRELRVCNEGTVKAFINTTSAVSASNGVTLWPNAGTAPVGSNCYEWKPDQSSGVSTVDGTAVYGFSVGTSISLACLP